MITELVLIVSSLFLTAQETFECKAVSGDAKSARYVCETALRKGATFHGLPVCQQDSDTNCTEANGEKFAFRLDQNHVSGILREFDGLYVWDKWDNKEVVVPYRVLTPVPQSTAKPKLTIKQCEEKWRANIRAHCRTDEGDELSCRAPINSFIPEECEGLELRLDRKP